MKKHYIIALLILITGHLYSQNIKIGQDFSTVKSLVEYNVNNNNSPKSYGNNLPKMEYEIKYERSGVSSIYIYQKDVIYIDLNLKADTIIKYIFNNDILLKIEKSLTNISLNQLTQSFDRYYKKTRIGVLYFSEDYKYYNQIIVEDGYPTILFEKFNHNEFPNEFYTKVFERQKQYEDGKESREVSALKRRSLRRDYFNIDDYIENYSAEMIPQIERAIIKLFRQDLDNSIGYDYKGVQKIKSNCRLRFYSERGREKNHNIDYECDDLHIDYKNLLWDIRFKMPKISETFQGNEYSLNREFYMECKIDLVRGALEIKNKKGKKVEFISEHELTDEQKDWISKKMKERKSGKYTVMYQFGEINKIDATAIYIKRK
jgi:hypothetical protein